MRIAFEMETSDPDDFLTLLWLSDHPAVELTAVVVTPGTVEQCRLVRWGLDRTGNTDVPIGSFIGPTAWTERDARRSAVSSFHARAFGGEALAHPPGSVRHGPALLMERLGARDVTMLVGSPPRNLGAAFAGDAELRLARWVQQGGFAGDDLVPRPLDKFRGRRTCASFNPGGAPIQTMQLLADPRIARRVFISKDVCHGVVFDATMRAKLAERLGENHRHARPGLSLLLGALDHYLEMRPAGKALHDLVAAAFALDERICELREVEIYRAKGEWGARPAVGSNTWISVGFEEDRFLDVLAGTV